MGAQAKGKSPFEDALASLATAAAEGDEEQKAAAKKMLAAHYGAESDDGDKEPKDGEPEDKAKAETEDDEAKKAKAKAESEEEAKKAQARAQSGGSNELDLAQQVHALQAKIAMQEESTARAALLAQRPDFSAEVKKTLATVPLTTLEAAVKTWPRVNATSQASANATVPGVTPGQTDNAPQGIRAEQKALLDRMMVRGPQSTQARVEGSDLVLDQMTPEAAAKRLDEMVKQGLAPKGTPHDFARISNTTFKVAGK